MKRLLLLCSLFMTALSGCKKDDSQIYTPSYHIDGITDVRMVKTASGQLGNPSLVISLVYENSVQERVELSLEGVPQGLKDTIFVPRGIPSFSTAISFADEGVAEGTYPLTLVADGEYSGRREFRFNFVVTSPGDCGSQIVGNGYSSSASCSGSTFTQSVTAVPGVKNRILFSNANGSGIQLFADTDCIYSRLTIPSQSVNGVEYYGYGSYSVYPGTQDIQLFIYSNSPSGNYCNVRLSR